MTGGPGDALRRLHVAGAAALVPAAWDAPSARSLVRLGFPALTAAPAPAGAIAAAVDVPVTLEPAGPHGPDELVERARDAGLAGLELAAGGAEPGAHAAAVAAARATGDGLWLCAVVDVSGEPEERRAAEASRRIADLAEAGADCVACRGIARTADVAAVAEAAPVPLGVEHVPGSSAERLAELGVARISVPARVVAVALEEVERLAADGLVSRAGLMRALLAG